MVGTTTMRERPINLKAWEVNAILEGRKTQLRRVVKNQSFDWDKIAIPKNLSKSRNKPFTISGKEGPTIFNINLRPVIDHISCPYGQPGDRLWARETWQYAGWTEEGEPHIGYAADETRIIIDNFPEEWATHLEDIWCKLSEPKNYDIDNRGADRKWRPGGHMPRCPSRRHRSGKNRSVPSMVPSKRLPFASFP